MKGKIIGVLFVTAAFAIGAHGEGEAVVKTDEALTKLETEEELNEKQRILPEVKTFGKKMQTRFPHRLREHDMDVVEASEFDVLGHEADSFEDAAGEEIYHMAMEADEFEGDEGDAFYAEMFEGAPPVKYERVKNYSHTPKEPGVVEEEVKVAKHPKFHRKLQFFYPYGYGYSYGGMYPAMKGMINPYYARPYGYNYMRTYPGSFYYM